MFIILEEVDAELKAYVEEIKEHTKHMIKCGIKISKGHVN